MKQNSVKRSKLWIWLVAGLTVLLAVLGIVLVLLGQHTEDAPVSNKLYWNIDKNFYTENSETGLSTREPDEDGLFRVRFACAGDVVIYSCADRQLVNYIDTMYVMGLALDHDGTILDVVDYKTFATEVANCYFVSYVSDNEVKLNSSIAMNGMELTVKLTDRTGVYNVSAGAQEPGKADTCQIMDEVYVYADTDGTVTDIFIAERVPEADVYWRVERMYDTNLGRSTRVPDENGVYTILFAKDGEHVELKCKDPVVLEDIDGVSELYGAFAFAFDEEGYIIETINTARAIRGKQYITDGYVTGVDGDTITVTGASGAEMSRQFTFVMNDTCDIFMTCEGCYEHLIGERTDHVQLNDRVKVYTDLENNPVLIFVMKRTVDSPMYYVLNQKYNWKTMETARVPNGSGYYVYEMLADGKPVTLRTKDKAIANEIDYRYDSCMGLKVNGDVIEKFYTPRCVSGNYSPGFNRYITSLSTPIISISSATDFNTAYTGLLSPDCKIYDVTGYYGVKKGSQTQLQMYDRVTTWLNVNGEIEYAFVTERYVEEASVYYNVGQRYSGAKQETTREPDAEGYYVFTMIKDGKEVTTKTKSKDLASYIDKQYAPIVSLVVRNGIIQKAYPATAAVKYGKKVTNTHYVNAVNAADRTFTTYYIIDGVRTNPETVWKMAENCAIYNVSSGYSVRRGEKTTLKPDDQIQSIAVNPNGEVVMIFVMGRKFNTPLYWNMDRQYNTTLKETTRQPDADGYYVFNLAVNGEIKQFKTKDKAIASEVDRWTVAFTMLTEGDIIKRVMSPVLAKGIYADAASGFDIMGISANKLSLKRNHPSATNYGETKELELASNYTVYDVSTYAQNRGAAAKLELGDRVQMYSDAYGKVVACFITYKNTHKAGHISHCEHCDKDVFWVPYISDVASIDAHYYLTHDYAAPWQPAVGSAKNDVDAVLDLNGFTMTSKKRGFLVQGTLSIVDTVGGGKIQALTDTADTKVNGGVMMIAGGTVNLYSGTLTVAKNTVTPDYGGVVYVSGEGSVLNVYGGTITGGSAALRGGNVYVYKAELNMTGGKIDGDVEIYSDSTVTLSGAPVIAKGEKTGLKLATGNKITLGALTQGASVAVEADGIFTKPNENAASYTKYFTSVQADAKIVADGNVLRCVIPGGIQLDANGYGMCEHCGESVKWEVADPNGLSGKSDGAHHHYYLAQDVEITWGYLTLDKETALCLHLNGKSIKQASRIFVYGNSTLNIMGSGSVTSTGTGKNSTGTVTVAQGTLNVYGGGFASAAQNGAPAIAVTGAKSYVNFLGGSVTDGVKVNSGALTLGGSACADSIYVADVAKLTVNGDWTGNACVKFESIAANPIHNGQSTGAFTGTLKLDSEGDYKLVGQSGKLFIPGYVIPGGMVWDENGLCVCDYCGKAVQWEVADPNGLSSKADGGHHHLYLAKDVNINWGYLTLDKETTLCLNLNGKSITQATRIFVYGNSTLNIMGQGSVTSSGTGNNSTGAVTVSQGTANIYGGSFTSTAENGAPAMALVGANAKLNLLGGDVTNGITATKGVVNISGAAAADRIYVASDGKLTVAADWTGSAKAAFESLIGGEISETNGISLGEYTGTLTLDIEEAPAITGKDGKLVVQISEEAKGELIVQAANAVTFPATGSTATAVCPIHGSVTWEAKNTGLSAVNDGQVHHYYLTKDFTYNWGYGTITEGSQVCLHLNGHTISQGHRIYVSGNETKLNIMGSGTVLGAGTATSNTNKTGTLTVHSGTVNLYGGTYLSAAVVDGVGVPVILGQTENACINMFDGVTVDGSYDSDGNGEADVFVQSVKLVGAKLNQYGGTIQNGKANSGGNLFASAAEVNLFDGAVINGGAATAQGGNIHLADGSRLNTCGTITGGTTSGSAAHGGNVSMVSNCRIEITGGEISGGKANGQGGNLRAYNATVIMTGGSIFGGDSLTNVNDNVWLAGSSVMTMTGGTVKGTDSTESYGTAIDLAGTAVLNLGGDAAVSRDDGVKLGLIRLYAAASKLNIFNDWTGTASVKWYDSYTFGSAVKTEQGQCGSLVEGVFTPGGSYTGILTNEYGDAANIVGKDGALSLASQS